MYCMRMARRLVWASSLAALWLLGFSAPTRAHAESSDQDQRVAALIQRVAQNSAAPDQYSADVKVHVRLRVFPWMSLTLHGSELYKHPGFYHFVFRGAPKAAEHFSDMAYDIGNAGGWPQKYDVSILGTSAKGQPVLRLVPKTRGLVRTLDVTVDPETARLEKWVWSRYDGGTISVTQRYETLQTRDVVTQQEACIRIPHMAADLIATYSNFALQRTVAKDERS
jgi:hypothetical protein